MMVVGEPSLMGGEFGDEDERLITRLENNQYDATAAAANGLDDGDEFSGNQGGPGPNPGGGPPPPNWSGGPPQQQQDRNQTGGPGSVPQSQNQEDKKPSPAINQ